MRKEFLPFSTPAIGDDEINEVVDSLRSGWITTGPKVKRFEEEFKAYVGSPFAVPLSSATAGLHLTLLALKIEPGDEIITTPMTFASTVSMIILCGGVPVLVDIEPGTLNIDVQKIREKITPRTKAIIPVHFAGQSCDMDRSLPWPKNSISPLSKMLHTPPAQNTRERRSALSIPFPSSPFIPTRTLPPAKGGWSVPVTNPWQRKFPSSNSTV